MGKCTSKCVNFLLVWDTKKDAVASEEDLIFALSAVSLGEESRCSNAPPSAVLTHQPTSLFTVVEEDFAYVWSPDPPVALFKLTCQKRLCVFSSAVALQVPLSLTKWVLVFKCHLPCTHPRPKSSWWAMRCVRQRQVWGAGLPRGLTRETGQHGESGGAHLVCQVQSSSPWQEKWMGTSALL